MKGEFLKLETARKLASREKAIQYIKHKRFVKEQVLNKKDYSLNDREVKELLNILESKI
jgi:hypothetical protein